MPSARSLAAGEYYAHPQNAFWRLLAEVLQTPPPAGYAAQKAMAARAGIAVWDVLAACRRTGSMDSAIDAESEKANDIAALLARRPKIAAVALNGGRAKKCFARHIQLPENLPPPRMLFLPSSSPANARMRFSEKAAAWMQIAPFVRRPL